MNAVGKLGSYISRSVYVVSGPFHPFGGAVDIIVVEQPDGSFKSSPWYVRFGKFQGVLKAREKVVSVSVNGVDADFHMYLDHKGEAYFLREVDVEGPDISCFTRSDEPDLVTQLDTNVARTLSRTDSRRSRILGSVFERKSAKEDDLLAENTDSGVVRTESLERAEIAADLLEVKWTTDLVYSRHKRNGISRLSSQDISEGSSNCKSVTVLHNSVDCHTHGTTTQDTMSVEDMESESKINISTFSNSPSQPLVEKNSTCDGEVCQMELDLDGDTPSLVLFGDTVGSSLQKSESSEEEQMLFGDMDDFKEIKTRQMEDPISQDCGRDTETETPVSQIKTELNEFSMPHHFHCSSAETSAQVNLPLTAETLGGKLKSISSEINIRANSASHSVEVGISRSLPNVQIPSSDFDFWDFDRYVEPPLHSEYFSSECTFLKQGVLSNVEAEVDNDHQSSMSPILSEDTRTDEELKKESGHPIPGNSSRPHDASSGNWRMWPFSFRRSKSMESSEGASRLNGGAQNVNERVNAVEDENNMPKVKVAKKRIRENTPTSAELASLNLKEGTNIITFTFSTPMLGKQQVDARIHLWKCDTRIVISDVDGTITRSDLLGQFMPMVGVDWSQIGVTNLFTAIKENGYHVLFLSARSISQAYNTRQFLLNLKQDGKAMPDGPVVISPDGLFPSLYREVVRRAPHEFKISCLEAIKALFPPDRNPFYAGFGNRDTDEVSYLKVGIPKGKIFIINPKGEITVNHRLDRKSYTSIHALVNDMFPLMTSLGQQEDYNSWNYWKIPPPAIDM